jgi:hypothetical protein
MAEPVPVPTVAAANAGLSSDRMACLVMGVVA